MRREEKNGENVGNSGEIECNEGRCLDALSSGSLCQEGSHATISSPLL